MKLDMCAASCMLDIDAPEHRSPDMARRPTSQFTIHHVGTRDNGRALLEHTLDGTDLVVCRIHPHAGPGWVVYDDMEGTTVADEEGATDAHTLADAKKLAIRHRWNHTEAGRKHLRLETLNH